MKLLEPKRNRKIPLGRALYLIFLSVTIVSGSAFLGWLYYHYLEHRRESDDAYLIKTVIQTGPSKESLKTVYLEELLGISFDKPTNLYQFNVSQAQQTLLCCPVIKTAKIKKIFPDAIYVDYSVRQPIAQLHDYVNAAIDEEGYVFPIQPFFTPKRLPEVSLDLTASREVDGQEPSTGQWNKKLDGAEIKLALDLFQHLTKPQYAGQFKLLRIDVANAYADSFGRREIVLIIEDQHHVLQDNGTFSYLFPRILRLSLEGYQDELNRYMRLRPYLITDAMEKFPIDKQEQTLIKVPGLIIDLRVPHLAFLNPGL